MHIAVNTLPLETAHKTRGIGYYTHHLIEALKEDPAVDVSEFRVISDIKDVDIVHYPWFDLFFHTLPLRRKFPTVVTVHDVIPLLFPDHYPLGLKGRINFMMQKTALGNCKYIITDSNASKEDIVRYLKIEDKKIDVIPLAADPKFKVIDNDTELLFVKRKYHLPDQFLLYVGDANWIKNLPFLIEGFSHLVKQTGLEQVKLVLVGGVFLKDVENISHPELESLKLVNKLIKQYGLNNYIIRPGQIDDDELTVFYNLATVYVQPSIYEGFGLPVLQALTCGTPVVSSNKGSLTEVGGDSALYFDPSNLMQFVSVVSDLLQDKSLQSKLSKFGLKQAAKFSWKKVAEETKLTYLKAVKHE